MSRFKSIITLIPLLFLVIGCPYGHRTPRFQLIGTFAETYDYSDKLNGPHGIVARHISESPLGPDETYIFVADCINNRVVIINSRLDSLIFAFGDSGIAPGQFIHPVNLTVTQNYFSSSILLPEEMFIYVADSKNHRIQKFNLNGEFIRQWGEFGTDDGQFNTPVGIDIDYEGYIYVADSGNHRIQVFDTSGLFIRSWGGIGNQDGKFNSPLDIAVAFQHYDSDIFSFVAVSDHGNNRVQIFNRYGSHIKSYNNIDDVLGIGIDYITTRAGLWVAAISGNRKELHFLSDINYKIENINEVDGPYDTFNSTITDSVGDILWEYGWAP